MNDLSRADGARTAAGPARPGSRVQEPPLRDFSVRVAVTMLIAILLLSLAYLVWSGAEVFLETFAGVLFAVFLSALSDWLSHKTGMRYGASLAGSGTAVESYTVSRPRTRSYTFSVRRVFLTSEASMPNVPGPVTYWFCIGCRFGLMAIRWTVPFFKGTYTVLVP